MNRKKENIPKGAKSPEEGSPEQLETLVLSSDLIEKELEKETYKRTRSRVLKSTIGALVVVAAAATLIAVLLFPVLQISGNSMAPTLRNSDIVLAMKGGEFEAGDVIAFYYGNDILLKRVIATPGQWVDIDAEGNVYVNGELLDEPYISEKALGDCDIQLPYQVPDGKYFVMGDHRTVSVDSRNKQLGCVDSKMSIGKIVMCIWPLSGFGLIN